MRLISCLTLAIWTSALDAFVFKPHTRLSLAVSSSSSTELATVKDQNRENQKKQLGLITFDLDDTLYPVAPVIDEANAAFARAMVRFGFEGVEPEDITNIGKKIREEMAAKDPESAAILTHTQIRELAIRRVMEEIILHRKLKETADDWATQVSSLGKVVVQSAKNWASKAVSPSIVQAVLTAWEMERHHAAERHLYPEVLTVLAQIRKDHPGVIIGAVTDGKANPLFMTFTLAKFFDFSLSWEDDQGARSKFFKDLGTVEGNAELSWIYNAAREKYYELSYAVDAINKAAAEEVKETYSIDNPDAKVWIHVGDDLAYDVGGSAACGAKTILLELDSSYGQTARLRFNDGAQQPAWSTSSKEELENRRIMNEAAKEFVHKKISFISRLPEAINEIIDENE